MATCTPETCNRKMQTHPRCLSNTTRPREKNICKYTPMFMQYKLELPTEQEFVYIFMGGERLAATWGATLSSFTQPWIYFLGENSCFCGILGAEAFKIKCLLRMNDHHLISMECRTNNGIQCSIFRKWCMDTSINRYAVFCYILGNEYKFLLLLIAISAILKFSILFIFFFARCWVKLRQGGHGLSKHLLTLDDGVGVGLMTWWGRVVQGCSRGHGWG